MIVKVPPLKASAHFFVKVYFPLILLALPVPLALIAHLEVAVPLNLIPFELTEPNSGPSAKLREFQRS